MKHKTQTVRVILSMLLIFAMVLGIAGCGNREEAAAPTATAVHEDGEVLGEGSREFVLTVVNSAGEEVTLEIHTDKETVGEALVDLGIIAGEEGDYGLYIKTVNGETVDFETDGKYWAFYVNGEYAMSGVDTTKITEGDSYVMKVE